jgi:hypothetical protein
MDNHFELNAVTSAWYRRAKNLGLRFAKIRTDRAIFDKVLIENENSNALTVTWPSRNRNGWQLASQVVPWTTIRRVVTLT